MNKVIRKILIVILTVIFGLLATHAITDTNSNPYILFAILSIVIYLAIFVWLISLAKKNKKIRKIFIGTIIVIFVLLQLLANWINTSQEGFKVHKNYVSYNGKKVTDVDPETFEVIGIKFIKDKNHVYFGESYDEFIPIKDADPDTFEIIGNNLNKDKNHVYSNDKPIKDADPDTFEIIGDNLTKDKNHVYFRKYDKFIPIKDADPGTFEIIGYNLTKDKNHVYFCKDEEFIPIKDADPNTFEIMADGAKDKNHVFSGSNYKKIDSTGPHLKNRASGYNKQNSDNVNYHGNIIESADLETFTVLTYYYAKDKNHVYFCEKIIQNADPKTFTVLEDEHYAKDIHHVYYYNEVIENADPKSFTIISSDEHTKRFYTKDKNHVYSDKQIVENADPKTFTVLDGTLYSKDKNHVYYLEKIIENADPKTFTVLQNYGFWGMCYTKDKNHVYFKTKIIENADPISFKIIPCDARCWQFYSKDKNHVYYLEKIIKNADPKTFRIIDNLQKKTNAFELFFGLLVFWSPDLTPNCGGGGFGLMANCGTSRGSFGKDRNYIYKEDIIIGKNKELKYRQ